MTSNSKIKKQENMKPNCQSYCKREELQELLEQENRRALYDLRKRGTNGDICRENT